MIGNGISFNLIYLSDFGLAKNFKTNFGKHKA